MVKLVMIGLILTSVWSWAIIIDKVLLYYRTKSSDGPLRERYSGPGNPWKSCIRRSRVVPNHAMAASVRGCDARMEAFLSKVQARSVAGLPTRIEKVLDVTLAREVDRLGEASCCFLPLLDLLRRSCRSVWYRLGHHEFLPGYCCVQIVHLWPLWHRALLKLCSRPLLACWPLFQP